MTKGNLIRYYRKFSAADAYIIGFVLNHEVYMVRYSEIMPRHLNAEEASRGQGTGLRLRIRKAEKQKMLKNAVRLGSDSDLNDSKYNKGEMFEKMVTEYYGQIWVKDNIPFTVQGDIRVNDTEIQIKLDGATLMTSAQMHRLQKVA